MNKKREIQVSNELIKKLKEKGYLIHKYYAKTTKSIYLKVDYGVCCGIRISDHKGKKKYKYKFNLIKKYNGPKEVLDGGYKRYFYDYKNTNELITDVDTEKRNKIKEYGLYKYNKYMRINANKRIYKSFKKVA